MLSLSAINLTASLYDVRVLPYTSVTTCMHKETIDSTRTTILYYMEYLSSMFNYVKDLEDSLS